MPQDNKLNQSNNQIRFALFCNRTHGAADAAAATARAAKATTAAGAVSADRTAIVGSRAPIEATLTDVVER